MNIDFFDFELGKAKISEGDNPSLTAVFPISDSLKLPDFLAELNDAASAIILKKINSSKNFTGKLGDALTLPILLEGKLIHITLLGIGDESNSIKKEKDIVKLGGKLYSHLNSHKFTKAVFFAKGIIAGFSADFIAANIAYGAKLKSYQFLKYFTKNQTEKQATFQELAFATPTNQEAEKLYAKLSAIASGVFFARNLISEPPNTLYPETYAESCKEELKSLGVKIEVLDKKDMQKLGMGALLGVAQGSVKEGKMVVMQWNGASDSAASPIAFVGKGVTFDTGGISIKPSNGMEEMKYDMAGSATVAGAIKALAARKAHVNAVGVIGLVENMPDGNAQRPGDIVKTMSGQTVEVLNTDAEGRLVLADALWYAQDRFKPKAMINIATLTGAMVVALGSSYAGIFSNSDDVSEKLINAGQEVDERLWRLPLHKDYDKMIDSKIADMQNISSGRGAGSITAAQFLQRFVNKTPWVHIDIAGVAWAKKATDTTPIGGAGFGVRLLDKLVANYYEG